MKKVFLFFVLLAAVCSCKKTDNKSGDQWTKVVQLTSANMNQAIEDMCLSDANTMWVVGAWNYSFKSTDGGKNWQKFVVDPTLPDYVSWDNIYFRTPQLGWIIGGNLIYKTTDGGNTWVSVFSIAAFGDIYTPRGVCFLSDTKGFICSLYGTLMRTDDGGASWYNQNLQTMSGFDLETVTFFDDNHGWVTGYNGTLFGTVDGGDHWTLLHGPGETVVNTYSNYSCYNIIATGPAAVMGINQGQTIRSTDGGNTWTPSGGAMPGSSKWLLMRNDHEGFSVLDNIGNTGNNDIAQTTDGGQNWTEYTINPAGPSTLQKIIRYGNDVYAFTAGKEIYKYNH